MAFKKEYANKIVGVKGSALNVRQLPGTNSTALLTLKAGQTAGRSSGQVTQQKDGEWIQINLYTPVNGVKYGYVRRDVVNLVEPAKAESPQAESNASPMVNEMLAMDKKTLANLERVYRIIVIAKKKGIDTSKIEAELKKYLDRLMKRQSTLIAAEISGLLTVTKVINSGIQTTDEYLNKYGITVLKSKKIGIAPVIIVVGGIIIGAVAAATIYYLLKPDYEDSKIDFKITENLQAEINKYVPKEKQEDFKKVIQQEAQPQLNDAYNQGKTDQKFGDIWSVGKYILIFGAGFYLVDKLITTQSSKRKAQAA